MSLKKAKQELHTVQRTYVVAQLAATLLENGAIREPTVERAVMVARKLLAEAERQEAEACAATATSAMMQTKQHDTKNT